MLKQPKVIILSTVAPAALGFASGVYVTLLSGGRCHHQTPAALVAYHGFVLQLVIWSQDQGLSGLT